MNKYGVNENSHKTAKNRLRLFRKYNADNPRLFNNLRRVKGIT